MTPPGSASRLEFTYGHDLLAAWLGSAPGPLLVRVSGPEHAGHVLVRQWTDTQMVLDMPALRAVEAWRRAGWLLPTQDERVRCGERRSPGEPPGALLWVPSPTWQEDLDTFGEPLAPRALLGVLCRGSLPRIGGSGKVDDPGAALRSLDGALAVRGWQLVRTQSLGTPTSLAWASAARIARVASRTMAADRFERRHHLAVCGSHRESRGAPTRVDTLAAALGVCASRYEVALFRRRDGNGG